MRHINTRLIVEQARDDELRKLQGLYFSDNAAFVKLVKPHIRFAWLSIECGLASIPFVIDNEGLNNLQTTRAFKFRREYHD